MGNPASAPDERFTYRHYKTWPDSERWELIEGHAWNMSAAPMRQHQRLVGRLHAWLFQHLAGKPCQAYLSPFDVLLPEGDEADDEVDTVVQPDIVVYCDRSRLTKAGARGAPDLVVEVLSPSTSNAEGTEAKDQREKFDLYQRHGVREYWVLDPAGAWLCVYRLKPSEEFDDGELRDPLREYGPIESKVLEGFVVEPAKLFEDMD